MSESKPHSVRLSPEEIESIEKLADWRGIAFAMDHLGLDGFGNEFLRLKRLEEQVQALETQLAGAEGGWQAADRLKEQLEAWETRAKAAEKVMLNTQEQLEAAQQEWRSLLNEVDCRIEHGAESGGHLEYVRDRMVGRSE